MSGMEIITGASAAAGVALGGFCIWLLVRAINRREVLWIAFTALPFALVGIGIALALFASFARRDHWTSF